MIFCPAEKAMSAAPRRVLYRFRGSIPWRDLPERFSDWKIVYQLLQPMGQGWRF
jgi:hypothetical protein